MEMVDETTEPCTELCSYGTLEERVSIYSLVCTSILNELELDGLELHVVLPTSI